MKSIDYKKITKDLTSLMLNISDKLEVELAETSDSIATIFISIKNVANTKFQIAIHPDLDNNLTLSFLAIDMDMSDLAYLKAVKKVIDWYKGRKVYYG